MPKYKQYYQKMIENNKEFFDSFGRLHFEYENDQEGLQDKFNEEGMKAMEYIREYEDRLCNQSERGGYSRYTGSLAEKFQEEVRKNYPLIDNVGIKTFDIRKISL
jgi:hypothetical protein